MDGNLSAIMESLIIYKYWLLLPIAIVEGPMVAFVCGMLVALGYFNPFIAFGILVLGDLIPDGFLYTMGRFARKHTWVKRWGTYVGVTEERFSKAEMLWHTHPGKTVLASKFTYGVTAPFLFMAGLSGIPARIFFGYSISISVVHYAVLMGLGYFFGTSLASIGDFLTSIEIGVTIVVLAGVAYYLLMPYVREKFHWD
ncbi:MAG: hypothetical protein Q7S50_02515 [bacterium]|nr:hypothetical protein [bacterium]